MKVLIIGNGGREHALAWKVAQAQHQVFVAPGNGGTALDKTITNVDIHADDIDGLLVFATKHHVDLTIVGPETPLAAGIVDRFIEKNLACLGPTQAAAKLESSKAYAKAFMKKNNIPTASYAEFTESKAAIAYLENLNDTNFPIVIKADGLAAGKGVVIAPDKTIAKQSVHNMLDDAQFGTAGQCIVIETFLRGQEVSYIVLTDGETILPMASSQDHKARDVGDNGPNTGGMGAYSPAPIFSDELEKKVLTQVIKPTLDALNTEGIRYTGFLYAGLMISENGDINVLEFNCRLGDPETQVILFRLKSDLALVCLQATRGELATTTLDWDARSALGVVLTASGYPFSYPNNEMISGAYKKIDQDCMIFHAGTKLVDNQLRTAGGRVLMTCALGDTLQIAQNKAYALAKDIHWEHQYYRTDIGHKALS